MLLVVGEIVRPHGLRGEVVVNVLTDEPAQRFAPGSVLTTETTGPARAAGNGRTGRAGRDGPAERDGRTDRDGPDRSPGRVPGKPGGNAPAQPDTGAQGRRWRTPPTLTVEQARPFQGRLIVEFDGVLDRDVAEELRGVLLYVDSADVPPSADPDEFNDHQLVGLTAVDVEGVELGEVVSIDHAPAADLLILRRPDGRTAMVPFVKAIVPEVDLAGGRVVLTPPEGLFDL